MHETDMERNEGGDGKDVRPQQGGEGGTTRFGMEDGDNGDTPATGGRDSADNAAGAGVPGTG